MNEHTSDLLPLPKTSSRCCRRMLRRLQALWWNTRMNDSLRTTEMSQRRLARLCQEHVNKVRNIVGTFCAL